MHGSARSSIGGPPPTGAPHAARSQLGVTAYERSAAALITALILVGVCVGLMFAFWLTTRVWVKPEAIAPELVELSGMGGNALGDAQDLADPLEELPPPDEPDVQQMLMAVTDVVIEQQAVLEQVASDGQSSKKGRGAGTGEGQGQGTENVLPRWERWEIRYNETSLQEYARQLDFFRIELAAIGGGRKELDYAFGLTQAKPQRRVGRDDSRIFFRWTRESATKLADLELLKKAGIPTQGREILKFIPPEVENQCAQLENQALRERNLSLRQVRKTVFMIVPRGAGYVFEVARITVR